MNINIRAPFSSLGYGVVGRNIIRELDSLGHTISFFPIGNVQTESKEENKLTQRLINNQSHFDYNATSLQIWHQFDLPFKVGNGPSFVFPIWEVDKLSEREVHHLGWHSGIFTTCHWYADILDNYSSLRGKNSIVPLGVDTSIFRPNLSSTDNSITTFFTCGKWEVRKGQLDLVRAFNLVFKEEDNVRLWMCCHNPFFIPELNNGVDLNKELEWRCKNSRLGNKISFLPRLATQGELAKVMCEVDCGVFLSHAEGWNLELLEMMSCGKPVIATNYSGHTAFCNSQNTLLVDINKEEPAHDGKWFFKENGGKWACIGKNQIDQTVEYMRRVHQEKKQNGSLFNKEGVKTAKEFSWRKSAEFIVKYLKEKI